MIVKTRLKANSVLLSTLVMIYFVMLVVHNIYQNQTIQYIWYFVLLSCSALGFLNNGWAISKQEVILLGLIGLTGMINIVMVGNNSISGMVFSVVYLGVYRLLANNNVDERFILLSIYADCILFAISIIRAGFGIQFMNTLSVNFVSVFLLIPTIVYYIKREKRGESIPLTPAIACTITAMLATGRGGIIVFALMLILLIIYVAFIDNKPNAYSKLFLRACVIFIGVLLIYIGISYSSRLLSLQVFQRFTKYGMYGTGRVRIWNEYWQTMLGSVNSIIFGVNYSSLPLMERYRNNLHNSFFNIHADYGIVFLIYIIYKLASVCKESIRRRKWIYLFMTVVFVTRASTDKIFGGGSSATVILFFLMFYSPVKAYKKRLDYKGGEVLIG